MHFIKNSFFMYLFYTFFNGLAFTFPLTKITTKGFEIGYQSVQYPSTSFFKRLFGSNRSSYFRISSRDNNQQDTAIHSLDYTNASGKHFAIYTAFINKKDYFIYESMRTQTLYLIPKIDALDTLDPYFKEKKDPIAFLIHEKNRLKKEYTQERNALEILKKEIENNLEKNSYRFYKEKQKYEDLRKKLLIKKEDINAHLIPAFDERITCAYTKKITPDQWVIVKPDSEEILSMLSKNNHDFDFENVINDSSIPHNALLMMAAILHRKNNTFIGQQHDYYWIGAGLLGTLGTAGAIHLFMQNKQSKKNDPLFQNQSKTDSDCKPSAPPLFEYQPVRGVPIMADGFPAPVEGFAHQTGAIIADTLFTSSHHHQRERADSIGNNQAREKKTLSRFENSSLPDLPPNLPNPAPVHSPDSPRPRSTHSQNAFTNS